MLGPVLFEESSLLHLQNQVAVITVVQVGDSLRVALVRFLPTQLQFNLPRKLNATLSQ